MAVNENQKTASNALPGNDLGRRQQRRCVFRCAVFKVVSPVLVKG